MSVSGSELSAALISAEATGVTYNLTVRSYSGIVRVLVDEPGADRYQVPDIVLPEVEQLQTAWESPQVTKTSWKGSSGPAAVELTFSPFKLAVSVGGKQAAVINSRSMFAFEHRRNKTVSGQPAIIGRACGMGGRLGWGLFCCKQLEKTKYDSCCNGPRMEPAAGSTGKVESSNGVP